MPANDRIDDAYQAKYKGSRYLNPMMGFSTYPPKDHTARVEVQPRGPELR
jgi:hypothetical protein